MDSFDFDVVIVADFSEAVARRFEIMTLFFLASWLEFGGRSRDLPLHIACIGEAPESVRILGAKCNASITTHDPMLFGGFANKLRGFKVKRQTDHLLLLDSDMLVLSELNDLGSILGSECISAAAANGPCVVPMRQWEKIHEILGIHIPDIEVLPLNRELDTFQCAEYRNLKKFAPYFNGGIVFAPWDSGLGDVWEQHLTKISPIVKNRAKISNQPSLATAIAKLMLKGYDFRLLPHEYHTRWQHIATGALSSRNARLLHTIGFGRWSSKGNKNTSRQEIDIYLFNVLRLTRMVRSHRGPLVQRMHYDTQEPYIDDCHRIHELMEILYDKHVHNLKP